MTEPEDDRVGMTADGGSGGLLVGRVAVVTGAGGGIGAATARLFAEHGASVVVADIDAPRALEITAEIVGLGGAAVASTTDVRDVARVKELRELTLDTYGQVDVLVNNVGHWVRHTGDFLKGDPSLWDELHEVNFLHVLTVTHAFLPSMIERARGSVVNVTSIEAIRGYPHDPVYAAYKAAVVQFTRSLAVQIGYTGVRVNGIAPDVTESLQVPYSTVVPPEQQQLWPMWVPVGRMGVPEDQARVLLFLASDLSAFITGQTIPTDGGTGAAGGSFRSPSRNWRWTNRPIDP
jgi:NAD(P)-dependent dehydrogenase (short-subunit alcohol dehydrogenase family)